MPKSYWWVGGVGGPFDFSVSPWSKSFFFPFLGDFYSTCGSVGTGLGLGLGLGLDNILPAQNKLFVTSKYLQ